MKKGLVTAFVTAGLTAPSLSALAPIPEVEDGAIYIETLLCATGRVVRIPLFETPQDEREEERHNPMPACHALCSRDSLDEDGGETEPESVT